MTRKEALEILEEEDQQQQQKGEILAELGSSAFYGGAQGWGGSDAMQIARQQFDEMIDHDAAAAWDLKVQEAKAYMDAFPMKITYHFPYKRPAHLGDPTLDYSDDIPF
jgi:coenzyme F420-reducing hydrogenase gamma subunit